MQAIFPPHTIILVTVICSGLETGEIALLFLDGPDHLGLFHFFGIDPPLNGNLFNILDEHGFLPDIR
jgi:hypothetical protein